MKNEEIREILKNHRNWLYGFPDGFRADLHGATLRGADLHEVILRNADLREADLREASLWVADLREADLREIDLRKADLRGADLREADLRGADLRKIDLRKADLRGANLREADLRGADLRGADLHEADLNGATLWGANFHGANLQGANLREAEIRGATALYLQCPETGSFIAYKKLNNNAIATLEIPEEAKRSSATTRKCRAEKVRVLKIERGGKEVNSEMSARGGLYEVGKETVADSWDCDRWNECSHGIHFFITRWEAEEW